ncbi:MAG: hypothetical protein R3320_11520 [Nitriliruptorales bacterium]|nr:hypothetical protein [Nitriliruptorales bacterium]
MQTLRSPSHPSPTTTDTPEPVRESQAVGVAPRDPATVPPPEVTVPQPSTDDRVGPPAGYRPESRPPWYSRGPVLVVAILFGTVGLGLALFGGLRYLDGSDLQEQAAEMQEQLTQLEDDVLSVQQAADDLEAEVSADRALSADLEDLAGELDARLERMLVTVEDAGQAYNDMLDCGRAATSGEEFLTCVTVGEGEFSSAIDAAAQAVEDARVKLQDMEEALGG